MAYYICESYDFSVDHGGRSSEGVLGEPTSPQIKEKIYLHLLPLTDAEVAKLAPRKDEDGNVQHARLALPRDEVFWIAVLGEIAYPKVRPRVVSKCADRVSAAAPGVADGPKGPTPQPITPAELELLRKFGTKGLP